MPGWPTFLATSSALDEEPDAHPQVSFHADRRGRYVVAVLNPSPKAATVGLAMLRQFAGVSLAV